MHESGETLFSPAHTPPGLDKVTVLCEPDSQEAWARPVLFPTVNVSEYLRCCKRKGPRTHLKMGDSD